MNWDLFLCFAGEDWSDVAQPLADLLRGRGLEVICDAHFALHPGDRLLKKESMWDWVWPGRG